MELIGFRLRVGLGQPFYCLECAEAAAKEKGWNLKTGDKRKNVGPVVRTQDGVVWQPKVGGGLSGPWYIEDEEIGSATASQIVQVASNLGFKMFLAKARNIVTPSVRCGRCNQPIITAPGMPLGLASR